MVVLANHVLSTFDKTRFLNAACMNLRTGNVEELHTLGSMPTTQGLTPSVQFHPPLPRISLAMTVEPGWAQTGTHLSLCCLRRTREQFGTTYIASS